MALTLRPAQLYTHTQAVPDTTWVIEHNLNDYPIVDVFVTYEGVLQKIIPSSVVYTSPKICTISFTTAYAGYATVV